MIVLTDASNPNPDAPLELDATHIQAFFMNEHDPNGGSLIVMDNGAEYAVRETVEEIAALMPKEKDEETQA